MIESKNLLALIYILNLKGRYGDMRILIRVRSL